MSSLPLVVDLSLAMEGPDGTRLYTQPLEAAMTRSAYELGKLWREYPHETSHALALTAWASASAYFLYQALAAEPRPVHRR